MRDGTVDAATLECLKEWVGLRGLEPGSDEQSSSVQLTRLSRTIEGEIIPRLMMLLQPEVSPTEEVHEAPVREQARYSVEEFVGLLIRHDASVANKYVKALRSGGMPLTAIYLDLLAPAARLLGTMWEEDECTFTEVTVGVSRMHQVLLHFSPCFSTNVSEAIESDRTALIVPIPGEQHTFGLFMVVEFFRRAGWNIWSGNPATEAELLSVVRRNHFDLMGFSVSGDVKMADLPKQIEVIRKTSKNPEIKILVGGRAFTENVDLYHEVGADGTASDGMDAVQCADALVDKKK